MNKKTWLDWAELFDSWRIVPRTFFASYFIFWCWITVTLLLWYTNLPSPERTLEASGFGSAIFLTATAFLKQIYTTYSENGRNWNDAKPTQTIVQKETSVTTQ